VQGFGVRLTPTKASYVVQWRESSAKRPRETLPARVGSVSCAHARDLARKRLSEVTGNAEHGGGVSLRMAMRSWYDRQCELGEWRPRYRERVDSVIAIYVEGEPRPRVNLTPTAHAAVEKLGAKPVAAVTRADVMKVADALRPGTAEGFMAIVSSFYGAAMERDTVQHNPARNRLRVTGGRRKRKRKFSDTEFVKLWTAFKSEGDPAFGAFELLAFTGCRRREVTELPWSELDLDASLWTLPPERRKTGRRDLEPFPITLHPSARAVIKRQPVLKGSPFVFWGRRDKRPFDFQHATIDRVRPAITDWVLHDLRRYMRSGMNRIGITQAVAEQCLGHLVGGLIGVYDQHSYAEEKAAAWRAWGDHLTAITKAGR
jgi:integrase